MRYSFIIPVYNRPEEVDELLNSLTRQTNKNFEVLIVEDGSSVPCKEVVDNYADRLDICYYFKSNSGPGQHPQLWSGTGAWRISYHIGF